MIHQVKILKFEENYIFSWGSEINIKACKADVDVSETAVYPGGGGIF